MTIKIVVFDETEDKKTMTCYLYKCEPKKYKYKCRFMKHKIEGACVKIVMVKYPVPCCKNI